MNKNLKIALIVIGLLIIGLAGFLGFGFYAMEIEDRYGNNQDVFYNSRQGDIVVNHYTKEFGLVVKTWTRFYVINNSDTINTTNWWNDKNIGIYRPVNKTIIVDDLTYSDINRLITTNELELTKKLR